MLRATLTTLLNLVCVCGFCQLRFNTDTLYSISKDSGETETPILGQVWFVENEITDDTVILTTKIIRRSSPRYNFAQNGELEINACFLDCGKYTCDYFGSWEETNNGELKLYFANEDGNRKFKFLFSYVYLENKTKLKLKKINSDYKGE